MNNKHHSKLTYLQEWYGISRFVNKCDNNNNTFNNDSCRGSRISPTEIHEIRSKWLVNLTKQKIPQFVMDTLCLGDKFNFFVDFSYTDAFQIFKSVETGIYYNKLAGDKIREDITNIVNSHSKNKPHISYIDKIINHNLT